MDIRPPGRGPRPGEDYRKEGFGMKQLLSLVLCLVLLLGLNGLKSVNGAQPEDCGAQPMCDDDIGWVLQ